MANYAYVENGEIVTTVDVLPKSWKNISGLHLLVDDIPSLISTGWYPIQKLPEDFNPELSYLNGYTYELHEDYVNQVPTIIDYTEQELAERLEQKKNNFFSYIRSQRDILLKDTDWTMVVDVTENKTEEWVSSWKTYRQELRDLPQTYADTTDYDTNNIIWPKHP